MDESDDKRISDFLDELARAASLLATYWKSPREAMQNFGLSPDQQRLLQSGDLDEIRAAIEQEHGLAAGDVLYFHVCIVRVDPKDGTD